MSVFTDCGGGTLKDRCGSCAMCPVRPVCYGGGGDVGGRERWSPLVALRRSELGFCAGRYLAPGCLRVVCLKGREEDHKHVSLYLCPDIPVTVWSITETRRSLLATSVVSANSLCQRDSAIALSAAEAGRVQADELVGALLDTLHSVPLMPQLPLHAGPYPRSHPTPPTTASTAP